MGLAYAKKLILHQALGSVMYTSVRLVQLENAELPMLVTLSGIVMLARLVQYSNAESAKMIVSG